jgi:hypothetical protein
VRDPEIIRRVRFALSSPKQVADMLNLKVCDSMRDEVMILCPVHGEKNASCSVRKRKGTISVRCYGCQFKGDVLTLVALTHGLDDRSAFPEVLATACELAGMWDEADAVRKGKAAPEAKQRAPLPPPEPEPDYPPAREVSELWDTARPVTGDPEASALLVSRRIDPDRVAALDLARVLDPLTFRDRLPRWACFKGKRPVSSSWTKTGHRMLARVFDAAGEFRSVRAWQVDPSSTDPKRVPPAGHRSSGLVLANERAQRWLRGDSAPSMVVVVEGEPDWIVRSVLFPHETIVGIGSGSWTAEFAERVPFGSQVVLMTHLDRAGDRYAEKVAESVKHRAQVTRWELTELQ